jgi:hypothetical protein
MKGAHDESLACVPPLPQQIAKQFRDFQHSRRFCGVKQVTAIEISQEKGEQGCAAHVKHTQPVNSTNSHSLKHRLRTSEPGGPSHNEACKFPYFSTPITSGPFNP